MMLDALISTMHINKSSWMLREICVGTLHRTGTVLIIRAVFSKDSCDFPRGYFFKRQR